MKTKVILVCMVLLISLSMVSASEVDAYFFWGDGCPHCAEQKPFMEELDDNYPGLTVHSYETWNDPENAELFREMAKEYGTSARGVPATFVGDKYWVGYNDQIGSEIEAKVNEIIDEQELCVHVFLDYSCGECEEAKEYIDSLGISDVVYHNVSTDSELYEKFKDTYGLKSAGYPSVFIGDTYLVGIDSIKENFEDVVSTCKEDDCPCPAENIKGFTPSLPKGDFKSDNKEVLDIPLVGEVDVGKMPLIVMTGLISFVDGFNPCSLWVLTFLLGLVIYSGSRKKVLLVGLTFLTVTTIAYGAFMLGLLNVFAYIAYTTWINIAVALIATIFALVNIKDYFWYKKGISFTIPDKYKPKMFRNVRSIMDPNKSVFGMMFTTAAMALGIVLVELPCTAGFPMVWTNMVSQHEVSNLTFGLLLAMYLFIYLIIELVVFVSAVLTLKTSKFEEKHGRILKLVGGMIMLALAIALVFFPDVMNSVSGSIYIFGTAIVVSYIIMYVHRKVLGKGDKK